MSLLWKRRITSWSIAAAYGLLWDTDRAPLWLTFAIFVVLAVGTTTLVFWVSNGVETRTSARLRQLADALARIEDAD